MAMDNLATIKHANILIVEGKDELGFLVRMLKHLDIENVQIHMLGGVNNLKAGLGLVTKMRDFGQVHKIGILLDSDSNPANRLDSIRQALKDVGLASPAKPLTFEGNPKVIYMTVPSDHEPGCLEDLIKKSASDDARAACVDNFLSCTSIERLETGSLYAKAWVHSFISTSTEPGLKIGEASGAAVIDVKHLAFESLHSFLSMLAA